MSSGRRTTVAKVSRPPALEDLLKQYGCGAIQFTGSSDALYERHLMFDNVIDPAAHRSARALRGRRPIRAGHPLAAVAAHGADLRAREPQARLLSLHGVPHRALACQQHHEPPSRSDGGASKSPRRGSTGSPCSSRSPMPVSEMAGLDGSRPASSTRWRRCRSRRWATACGTNTASSGRRSGRAGSTRRRINWLRRPDPWEVARPQDQVEVRLGCSFEVRSGTLAAVPGQPSTLLGIPFDRPGRRLRRQDDQHAPALGGCGTRGVRLSRVQRRRLRRRAGRAAHGRIPDARPLSRRLHEHGAGPALRAGVLPRRLLAGRPRAALPQEQLRVARAPRQGRHPAQRHPSQPGRRRADADPSRRGASRMGRGLEPHAADARLHEPHAAARGVGEVARAVVRAAAAAPSRDHPRDRSPPDRRRAGPLSR